jgi:hypothetical protein
LDFVLVQVRGLFLEVVVLVVGLESLQVVSLLGVLPLEFTTGMGGVVALRTRRGTVHGRSRGFGPPPGREGLFPQGGYRGGVRGGSFGRRDPLVGVNPTFEQMAQHWFYSFGTNPSAESFVRSRARFLISGGRLENIWLIDSGCSRHMTGDRGWFSSLVPVVTRRYITFGDNGRGRVLSEGEIRVSDKITLRRVALVQSLGYNLLSMSQLLDEGFEVLFRPGSFRILDSRGDLVCMVIPEGQVFRADFS